MKQANQHSRGPAMFQGRAILLSMLLVCSFCGGCWIQTDHPGRRIPLNVSFLPGEEEVVAVGMRLGTRWYHLFEMLNMPKPAFRVEEVCLERVDLSKPTIYSYPAQSVMIVGSVLTFFRETSDGYAVFRPGSYPCFWMPFQENGNLSLQPVHPGQVPLAICYDSRHPERPLPGQPIDEGAAFKRLLETHSFWSCLRSHHFWGSKKAEVRIVCRTVIQARRGRPREQCGTSRRRPGWSGVNPSCQCASEGGSVR